LTTMREVGTYNNVPHFVLDSSSDEDVPVDLIAAYFCPIPHDDHIHVMIYRRENPQGRISVRLIVGDLPGYRAKRVRLYGPP